MVTVQDGDRQRRISRLDALILATIGYAAKGRPGAMKLLMELMRYTGLDHEREIPKEPPLSRADKLVMAEYFRDRAKRFSPEVLRQSEIFASLAESDDWREDPQYPITMEGFRMANDT